MNTTADHSQVQGVAGPVRQWPRGHQGLPGLHTEAAGQIHRTKHWTWEAVNAQTQQKLGKKTILNNYCISIASNQAACTTCHVGYGWKDNQPDPHRRRTPTARCHDTTGNYMKAPAPAGSGVRGRHRAAPGSGNIIKGLDPSKIAQKRREDQPRHLRRPPLLRRRRRRRQARRPGQL